LFPMSDVNAVARCLAPGAAREPNRLGCIGDIGDRNARALGREALHDRLANPGSPTGDGDDFPRVSACHRGGF
jgi:hypothetical protein